MNKRFKVIIIILIIVIVIATAFLLYMSFEKDILRMQYPIDYQDSIKKYSDKYGLDPYFVSAVIFTESRFNKDAESGAGAKGLMQIMDETAEWISGKLDVDQYDIFDPEINIEFGCWYLNYLSGRFNGEKELILAAYNAGPNRVEQWLESEKYSSDGDVLHTIPYDETSSYVSKVMDVYEKYKEIYSF